MSMAHSVKSGAETRVMPSGRGPFWSWEVVNRGSGGRSWTEGVPLEAPEAR